MVISKVSVGNTKITDFFYLSGKITPNNGVSLTSETTHVYFVLNWWLKLLTLIKTRFIDGKRSLLLNKRDISSYF